MSKLAEFVLVSSPVEIRRIGPRDEEERFYNRCIILRSEFVHKEVLLLFQDSKVVTGHEKSILLRGLIPRCSLLSWEKSRRITLV